MKIITLIGSMLFSALLLFAQTGIREYFDDLNYADACDPLLIQHGWSIVDGINAPPVSAIYSSENIRFIQDPRNENNRFMSLTAATAGTKESTRIARIESDITFYEGTYVARVFFDNALRKTQDGNIQTFYTINPDMPASDSLYSECDMEYLPYDIWKTDNNTKSALYFSTWESYQPEPYVPNHASNYKKGTLSGWHILMFQIVDGVQVRYFMDSNPKPMAEHTVSPSGAAVYPESPMQIAFANWLSSLSSERTNERHSTMLVDWVYYFVDNALTIPEVKLRVRELQKQSISFLSEKEK